MITIIIIIIIIVYIIIIIIIIITIIIWEAKRGKRREEREGNKYYAIVHCGALRKETRSRARSMTLFCPNDYFLDTSRARQPSEEDGDDDDETWYRKEHVHGTLATQVSAGACRKVKEVI